MIRRLYRVAFRRLRLLWHRHPYIFLVSIAASVLLIMCWTSLAAFMNAHGTVENFLKFAPVAGPVLGIAVFWWQVSRARYNQRIDLIVKMAERFDKQEMRTTRSRAAKALLINRNTRDDSVSQVLDFFEELGFLLARKAVDDEAVYTFFDYWIVRYFLATTAYREFLNHGAEPPDFYCKVRNLFELLADRAGRTPTYDDGKIDQFLRDESNLAPAASVRPSVANNPGSRRWNAGRRR